MRTVHAKRTSKCRVQIINRHIGASALEPARIEHARIRGKTIGFTLLVQIIQQIQISRGSAHQHHRRIVGHCYVKKTLNTSEIKTILMKEEAAAFRTTLFHSTGQIP